MSSAADIANMALGHLGIADEVNDVETERSKEARAVRRYWAPTRDALLRQFPWSFATRLVTLMLVSSGPTTEWSYSYRYPTDALRVWLLPSGMSRMETRDTEIPYDLYSDASGKLIYTSLQSAAAKYTIQVTNTELWSPDFTLAYSYMLADAMAARLTNGDQFKLGAAAMQKGLYWLGQAMASAAGESVPDVAPDSEFVTVRG